MPSPALNSNNLTPNYEVQEDEDVTPRNKLEASKKSTTKGKKGISTPATTTSVKKKFGVGVKKVFGMTK
jgi:hypothetical protein